uniref:Glycoside hydrolase family 5 domain-containing protein n=1 Tax=Meloidogyne javanica TaxID=6303 RepID=A0A915MF24_MELJA
MGEGGRWAQLRGMSLFHSQMVEGAVFYNAETVYKLKCNWHVNVVRACLGIMNYGNGGYFVHRELERAKVKAVIDAAIKYDIYVVAIRENDKDAVIICATPYYDQHISEAIKYPITNYYNIMCVFS